MNAAAYAARTAFEEYYSEHNVSALPMIRWVDYLLEKSIGSSWESSTLLQVAAVQRLYDSYGGDAPIEKMKDINSEDDAGKLLDMVWNDMASKHGKSQLVKKKSSDALGTIVNNITLRLDAVTPGSPAEKAGCSKYVGWKVSHINGNLVRNLPDIQAHLREESLTIKFFPMALVTSSEQVVLSKKSGVPNMGFRISAECLVESIVPNSPASSYRHLLGMRIYQVDGESVTSRDMLIPLLSKATCSVTLLPRQPNLFRRYRIDVSKRGNGIQFQENKIASVVRGSPADASGFSQFTDWHVIFTSKETLTWIEVSPTPSHTVTLDRNSSKESLGFHLDHPLILKSITAGTASEKANLGKYIGCKIVGINGDPLQVEDTSEILKISTQISKITLHLIEPMIYMYSKEGFVGITKTLSGAKPMTVMQRDLPFLVKSVQFPAWMVLTTFNEKNGKSKTFDESVTQNVGSVEGSKLDFIPRVAVRKLILKSIKAGSSEISESDIQQVTLHYTQREGKLLELLFDRLMRMQNGKTVPPFLDLLNESSDREDGSGVAADFGKLSPQSLETRRGSVEHIDRKASSSKTHQITPNELTSSETDKDIATARKRYEDFYAANDVSALPMIRWVDFLLELHIGLTWEPETIKQVACVLRLHEAYEVPPPVNQIKEVSTSGEATELLNSTWDTLSNRFGKSQLIHKTPSESLGTIINTDSLRLDHVSVGSPADKAGCSKYIGWRVSHINDDPVSSLYDIKKHLREETIKLKFFPFALITTTEAISVSNRIGDSNPGFRVTPDLLISGIVANSPAVAYRHVLGMRILSVNDVKINSLEQLSKALAAPVLQIVVAPQSPAVYKNYVISVTADLKSAGIELSTESEIVSVRKGSAADLMGFGQFINWHILFNQDGKITVSATPITEVDIVRDSVKESLGFDVIDSTVLVIKGVTPDSAAERCGLNDYAGYSLLGVNGVQTTDIKEVLKMSSKTTTKLHLQEPQVYFYSKPCFNGLCKALKPSSQSLRLNDLPFPVRSIWFTPWVIFCIFDNIKKQNVSCDNPLPFIGQLDDPSATIMLRYQVKKRIAKGIKTETFESGVSDSHMEKVFKYFEGREGLLIDILTERHYNSKHGIDNTRFLDLIGHDLSPRSVGSTSDDGGSDAASVADDYSSQEMLTSKIRKLTAEELHVRAGIDAGYVKDYSKIASQFEEEFAEINATETRVYQLEQQRQEEERWRRLADEQERERIRLHKEEEIRQKKQKIETERREREEQETRKIREEEEAESRMRDALRKRMQLHAVKKKKAAEEAARKLQEQQQAAVIQEAKEQTLLDAAERRRLEEQQLLLDQQHARSESDRLLRDSNEQRRRDVELKIAEKEQQRLQLTITPPPTKSTPKKKRTPGKAKSSLATTTGLLITLVRCRNLVTDTGTADPFALIEVAGKQHRSRHLKNTVHPAWNECFEISKVAFPGTLKITICDASLFAENETIGVAVLQLEDIPKDREVYELPVRNSSRREVGHVGVAISTIIDDLPQLRRRSGSAIVHHVVPPPIAVPYPLGTTPPHSNWVFELPPGLTDRVHFYAFAHNIRQPLSAALSKPDILTELMQDFGPEPKCPSWYILRALKPSYTAVVATVLLVCQSTVDYAERADKVQRHEALKRIAVEKIEQKEFSSIRSSHKTELKNTIVIEEESNRVQVEKRLKEEEEEALKKAILTPTISDILKQDGERIMKTIKTSTSKRNATKTKPQPKPEPPIILFALPCKKLNKNSKLLTKCYIAGRDAALILYTKDCEQMLYEGSYDVVERVTANGKYRIDLNQETSVKMTTEFRQELQKHLISVGGTYTKVPFVEQIDLITSVEGCELFDIVVQSNGPVREGLIEVSIGKDVGCRPWDVTILKTSNITFSRLAMRIAIRRPNDTKLRDKLFSQAVDSHSSFVNLKKNVTVLCGPARVQPSKGTLIPTKVISQNSAVHQILTQVESRISQHRVPSPGRMPSPKRIPSPRGVQSPRLFTPISRPVVIEDKYHDKIESPVENSKPSERLIEGFKNEMSTTTDDGIRYALSLLSIPLSISGGGSFLDAILVLTGEAVSPLRLPNDVYLTVSGNPLRAIIHAGVRGVCEVPVEPLSASMRSIATIYFNVEGDD